MLIRVRGSHHVFKKPDGSTFSIPVHHGKVKPFYWREVQKQIDGLIARLAPLL